jgi:DNA-binding LacI/PurR family transcriptional regulator
MRLSKLKEKAYLMNKNLKSTEQHATTIRDIAERAGVNRSTVSRVLNNSSKFPISEECSQRIKAIAEELNYHPRLSAKSLASGKSYNINLLLASIGRDLNSPTLSILIESIARELRKHNYNLILTPVSIADRNAMTREIQDILGSYTVDGTIIGGGLLDKELREQFNANRVPAILLDMHSKEEDFGCFPFIHHLVFDENPGQEQLLKHLIDLGHQRIAYLTQGPCRDITDAFRKAVGKYRFDFNEGDFFQFYDWEKDKISVFDQQMYYYRKTALLWEKLKDYSAIICTSSIGAQGVIEFLKDKGLEAGKDISLAGYDKLYFGKSNLTCINKSFETAGKKAVEILLKAIDNPDAPPKQVKIPTELFIGSTTVKALEK